MLLPVMHISCVICSDLFVAASDVFATGCGHLFHYACLIQWIERSKSCPQCRNKTTEKTIHRVYFNVASNELEEDTSVLRNKIDNLKFQIHLKDTDIKNATEENHTLNNQNKGLREEIKTLEFKIRSLESSISVFKDQIKYLQAQNKDAADAKETAKELRQQLDTLKSIQTIVGGTTAEVEDMLNKYGDSYDSRKSLATFVSVLKREVHAASDKKRDLRERLRTCHRDLSAANLEKEKLNEEVNLKSKLNKQLEDDLQHLESEKRSLQKKVCDLEKAISSPSGRNPRDSALQRLLLESPIPEAVRRPKLTDPAEGDSFTSTMFGNLLSPESKAYCQSEQQSPYLNIKSCSFGLTPLKGSKNVTQCLPSASNKFSIFNKPNHTRMASSVAANPEAAYDGLGGHSKIDAFPVSSPKFKPTQKKLKYIGTSKQKKKVTVSHKLDTFFDLT